MRRGTGISAGENILRRLRFGALYLSLLALGAFLVKNPLESADALRGALRLCAATLVPALFPFTVLGSLAVSLGVADTLGRRIGRLSRALFNISGESGAAVLFGLLAGYPCGAAFAAKLYKRGSLCAQEAERVSAFANNAGAAFVVGALGSMFGDMRVGVLVCASQAISALLCGIALGVIARRRAKKHPDEAVFADTRERQTADIEIDIGAALGDSVREGALSMLNLCGFVCFFAVLARFITLALSSAGVSADIVTTLCGLLEFSGGVSSAAASGGTWGITLAAFYIGWSGLCVHAQTSQLMHAAGLRSGVYTASKAAQAILCAALARGLCAVLGL